MTVVQPNSIAGINSISVQSGQSLSIHKSDGTLIREIVASTGISTYSSISVGSATTTNNAAKSINIGLGASIAQHADNTLSFGTNGDERARITSGGDINVHNRTSASTTDPITIDLGGQYTADASITHQNLKIKVFSNSSNNDSGGLTAAQSGMAYVSPVTAAHLFYTAPSSVDTLVERMRIQPNGQIGIGTVPVGSEGTELAIRSSDGQTNVGLIPNTNSESSQLTFYNATNDSAQGYIKYDNSSNSLQLRVNLAERLRIDSSGRLLMGSAANSHNGGDLIQLSATSSTASIQLNRYTANAHPSYINFFKSRNASISGQTVVQDDDTLGMLAFYGSDGTDRSLGAEVCAQVDGTPGSDDMPSRLVFRTSADGSQSPAERLRITSSGFVGIGEDTPLCKLDVDGGARFQSANTDKHQDGCIIERSSTDGIVHITAGRASGNYSGFNFYVAGDVGGSGANVKLRHQIDYQGNFKWYDSDGSTLRMHINTAGHIGIKTTGSLNGGLLAIGVGQGANTPSGEHIKIAPSANMITFIDSASNDNDTGNIQFWNSVYNNSSAKLSFYHPSGNTGGMKFYTHDGTALTERVNFTNTGTYNFGHTNNNAGSNGRFYVMSVAGQCTADLHHSVNDNENVLNIIHGGVGVNGNPTRVMVEWRNFANNAIATIQSNSTTITYGTGSDYRMKENQVDISDGITRVKQLKPYRFNWKSEYGGGDKVDGFFAHEAATVVPEAVQGTKDAVDSNGDIIRQQIDPSKLVPLLTAALQEAITKIETLETKVAALESS